MRFLEDWRNGAYFDRSDVKLIEQFEASSTLAAVKNEAHCGRLAHFCGFPQRLAQNVWLAMITRAISVQIGESVLYLDRKYQTDYFNAQSLLWPGEEDQPWLQQFPGARDELLQRRRLLLTRVFGEDLPDARRMVERMAIPPLLAAIGLRARFDPEYFDGSLGYTAVSDLEAAAVEPQRLASCRDLAEQTARDRTALLAFLQSHRPELPASERAEHLRAVRIAVHVNRQGLRRLVQQATETSAHGKPRAAQAASIADQVVRERTRYSRLLVGLRVHHELTRLHHLGYVELLEALYRSCLLSPSKPSSVARQNQPIVS